MYLLKKTKMNEKNNENNNKINKHTHRPSGISFMDLAKLHTRVKPYNTMMSGNRVM